MSDRVTLTSRAGVSVLTLQDPPVNALGGAMRQALWDAFDTLPADDSAVVVIGAGACFCGGVDLRELEPRADVPSFQTLMDKIEGFERPVIAALHGAATGGGLELAQACHFRVCARGTRLGQPEVTLGFPPGGGATQRLPRLIGVEHALGLLLSGQPITDSRAHEIGLIDARARGDLEDFAVQFAQNIVSQGTPVRRSRDRRDGLRDGQANQQQITRFRARIAKAPVKALGRIVDCVEAALLLPFDAGIAFEQAAFEECVASAQSQALRYSAQADRQAVYLPDAQSVEPASITHVALLGDGKRALDLAVMLLRAGLDVTLAGPSEAPLAAHVSTWFDRAAASGRLNADQATRAKARLRGPVPPASPGDVDLVIDASKPGALQDSGLVLPGKTPVALAFDGADPATVPPGMSALGLGFGIPAVTSDLIVVAQNESVAPNALLGILHLARRLAKQTVLCTSAAPDLTARMLAVWCFAAQTCIRDGSTPYDIDAAMRALGCTRGPYQLLDMAGLTSPAGRLAPRKAAGQPLPDLTARLREMSRPGRRTGQGVYLYGADHPQGRSDPQVVTLCAEMRQDLGLPEREISPGAIQRRCLIALANEAAYLRAEGRVARTSDLDVVMQHGLGFPRWRGGPVLMADQAGLLAMRRDLERLAAHDPFIWEPAPLLADLIKNGTRLSES